MQPEIFEVYAVNTPPSFNASVSSDDGGDRLMQIESSFAAAIVNARGFAKMANTAGIAQSASDQTVAALAELWKAGREAGLSGTVIQEIADRWVEWDDDGEPWPRPPGSNVIPLRR